MKASCEGEMTGVKVENFVIVFGKSEIKRHMKLIFCLGEYPIL